MDLAERLEALTAKNDEPLPVPETWDLTDEELKERYLDLLAQGFIPPEAAEQLGKTGRWFRGFRSEKSQRFDPDFAERYEELIGGEHREALLQRLRKAGIEEALRGNARLLEKWLMILDPEWAFLKPAQFADTVNIQNLALILPDVPSEILGQMISALEEKKRLALPVIDATQA